ncbi:hypothetical protein B0H14DRAFT_2931858 [Mycena olivaceomarginata]|nr:hypothetical protein B0H14DRAFT_2931858 [Mycena olivaceomarginata]
MTRHLHTPIDSPYTLYDKPLHYSHSSYTSRSRSSATSRSSRSSSWTPSTSTVMPSDSISQAGYRVSSSTHFPRSHPPSPHPTYAHPVHSHQNHTHPATYIVSSAPMPPSPYAYAYTQRTPGVIILSRPRGAPQVIVCASSFIETKLMIGYSSIECGAVLDGVGDGRAVTSECGARGPRMRGGDRCTNARAIGNGRDSRCIECRRDGMGRGACGTLTYSILL